MEENLQNTQHRHTIEIQKGDRQKDIINKLEDTMGDNGIVEIGADIVVNPYFLDKDPDMEEQTPLTYSNAPYDSFGEKDNDNLFVEKEQITFILPQPNFPGAAAYGRVKEKPSPRCFSASTYTYENYDFYENPKDQEQNEKFIEKNKERIKNLYYYPPTMTRRAKKGEDALKTHLECLYFTPNKSKIRVHIDKIEINKSENPDHEEVFQKSIEVFEKAITIQRDGKGNVIGNPFYYCEGVANGTDGSKSYFLSKVNRKYENTGGSSPSIARWMGAIAGTFVVVASAFVPRLG
jgi:hypothetical protein